MVKPGPPAADVVRVPGEGDREVMMEAGREDLLGRVDDEGADVGEENMSSKGRICRDDGGGMIRWQRSSVIQGRGCGELIE